MPEETTTTPQPQPRAPRGGNNLGIPVAIVIAAALIAGAIYLGGKPAGGGSAVKIPSAQELSEQQVATPEVAPVTEADHIRGNPNAPIVIVEYSDYDCPFCRIFHDTMVQVMEKYGADGKVAWVYRHFPINELHPSATKISEASECVAELGGNEAFWKFNDALNGSRAIGYGPNGNVQSVEPTDMTRMAEFAVTAGVDKSKFDLCYNSGKYTEKVQNDIVAAQKAGARGTPYSIMIAGSQQGPIEGAQPYPIVEKMIDQVLAQIGQ